MNEVSLENEIIILSTQTIIKLFSYKNGADLVALYLFYHKQCKLQGTNQSFTVSDFAKKGLHWGDERFGNAKKILKELNLIEDVADRDDKGIIKGWYIKLKYIRSLNNAILSSTPETHPLVESTTGLQETNALSNKLEMLKVNNLNTTLSNDNDSSANYKINTNSTNNELLVNVNNKESPTSKELVNEKENKKRKSDIDGIDMDKQFEGFWKLYPRNEGKKTARDSFMKKIKSTGDLFLLAFGLKKWLEEEKKKGTDPKFYPHCTTWLNQERFRDYEDQYNKQSVSLHTTTNNEIKLEDQDNVDWL